MKLSHIAAIVESVYYNGRVISNDKQLEYLDFLEMAKAANGDVMRKMYYEELQQGDANSYFGGAIVTESFPIVKLGRYKGFRFDDGGAVKLPYAMGILRIVPAMAALDLEAEDADYEDCSDEDYDFSDVYSRGKIGMESSFGSAEMLDDIGERFYIPVGNNVRLFGDDDAKYAHVDYIKNDDELDLPEAAAWAVLNQVLGPVLKVKGYPVDMTDNNNPNVTNIKNRLSEVQGVE